jgi:hypothetical protein
MDVTEKVIHLLEQAANLGVRAEFVAGLYAVRLAKAGDPEAQTEILEELCKYGSEFRRLLQQRALAAHAKAFVGQQIWYENKSGTLADVRSDGQLTIEIESLQGGSSTRMACDAESVLVITAEQAADAAALPDEKPAAEQPKRRGIVNRFLRG